MLRLRGAHLAATGTGSVASQNSSKRPTILVISSRMRMPAPIRKERGGMREVPSSCHLALGLFRTRAKARGVRLGRPPVLSVHQRQEVIQWPVEGATQADLARTYGVSQATISRLQPNPFGGANVGV